MTDMDKLYAQFAEEFERKYVSQGYNTNRDIEETLEIGWKLLSILPRSASSSFAKAGLPLNEEFNVSLDVEI